MNRRHFLHTLAVASGAGAGLSEMGIHARAAAGPSSLQVGSQLYGWGQYYERMGKEFDSHLDEVLSALRDAGYDYAEGSLDVQTPEKNVRFAERLRAKGLKPVSFYTGGRLHEAGKAEETVTKTVAAAKIAQTAGFSVINCNPDAIGREKNDAELKIQADALRQLGTELNRLGMRLGIHHHTPEMRNEAREFHANFRATPKEVVGFCYDVHWVYRGGVRPVEALRDYGDRVVSWHLRQSREQIWWEDMDTGDIDYSAIGKHARQHRLPPLYTVELAIEKGTKITRTVVENHQRSLKFVQRVFAG